MGGSGARGLLLSVLLLQGGFINGTTTVGDWRKDDRTVPRLAVGD